jgi:hypothetical protein
MRNHDTDYPTPPRRAGLGLVLLLAALTLVPLAGTGCAGYSEVATGLPFNRPSLGVVLTGARRASCIVGRSGDGGVWLSCPRRRGGYANVRFVNGGGGALHAVCEYRSPEYCSWIANQILSIGAPSVRVRIIR